MALSLHVVRGAQRLSSRSVVRNGPFREFRSASKALAAQNFTMPAMSPTMTEGNIASWKVKEDNLLQGDSFSTGDVLLEIETDKAQMDVEAQEDGKMAKIIQHDGAKSVKIGTRIAVLADIDDDLSTLTFPAESTSAPSPQEELKSGINGSKSSEPQAKAPPISKSEDKSASIASKQASPSTPSGKPLKQTYPLYPSVAQLLHEKGIPSSEANKIPTSGPKGRLLKGDVLAYLGSISSSYPSEQSTRITNLGHLDLSKIVLAPHKAPSPPPSSASASRVAAALAPEPNTEIAVSISLKKVLDVQNRIQTILGITLPLSTFIARATELANDELPRSAATEATANELFNQVLGLDKTNVMTSRGSFTPQIIALPSKPSTNSMPRRVKEMDIIDILAGRRPTAPSRPVKVPPPGVIAGSGPGESTNVFSVSAAKGEEKRARVFLERVKTILQVQPGSLVL